MSKLRLKRRRDVLRQKWQYIAVLVAVVLGVALFAGMFNAYLNLGLSLESTYERLVMADMTITGADEGFVDTASGVAGVDEAIERRQAEVPFVIGDHSLQGRAVGMPADTQPAINMVDIVEGQYLDSGDDDGILIEDHAASDFDLEVGDTMEIAGETFTIVGVAVSPEYLWLAKDRQTLFTPPGTFAVAFVDETLLMDLAGPNVDDQVLVSYEEDAVVEDVDTALESSANAANAADTQTLAEQPSNNAINLEIDALQTAAIALPLLFLAAAGMAIYVVITRLVYAQRGVIGTLRATGMTSRSHCVARHQPGFSRGSHRPQSGRLMDR